MNSLIILPEECVDPLRACLRGARATYAFETHGVRTGQRVKIAVLGKSRGHANVQNASVAEVYLDLEMDQGEAPLYPIDLIVGVPRPQTVKKVIQAGAILGVQSIRFVRSEQGEKSYLQSRALDENEVQAEVIKGLEQVWAATPPSVSVHQSLSHLVGRYVEEMRKRLAGEPPPILLLAHPGGDALGLMTVSTTLHHVGSGARARSHITLAIGPERGWSAGEVETFRSAGFDVVGLGERVMRVELAVVYLIAQLQALRLVS